MNAARHEMQSDFQTDVLDASHEQPVLVDFWADWCGPCRVLGPVLEKLADEAQGQWKLVKVDTEEHPNLAREYGVQGIPAVKLFISGEVVGDFAGALPEDQVRAWLQANLPTGKASSVNEAISALGAGDTVRARELLEAALQDDPDDSSPKLLLGQLLLQEDRERALTLLGSIQDGQTGHGRAQTLITLDRLREIGETRDQSVLRPVQGHQPNDDDVRAYLASCKALAESRYGQALEGWIEVMRRDRKLDDDGARQACVALFELLGPDHELTEHFHREFTSALF